MSQISVALDGLIKDLKRKKSQESKIKKLFAANAIDDTTQTMWQRSLNAGYLIHAGEVSEVFQNYGENIATEPESKQMPQMQEKIASHSSSSYIICCTI